MLRLVSFAKNNPFYVKESIEGGAEGINFSYIQCVWQLLVEVPSIYNDLRVKQLQQQDNRSILEWLQLFFRAIEVNEEFEEGKKVADSTVFDLNRLKLQI